jgi:uncharacterized membrane protein YgcG
MTPGDVDGNEMDEQHDIDDATAEALIAGLGGDDELSLTGLLGDMRVAYRSQSPVMSGALASFVAGATSPQPPADSRTSKMRSLITAKIAVVAATLVVGSGGLAVAGALPRPVQAAVSGAVSHVGLNLPHHASQHAVDATAKPKPASAIVKSHLSNVKSHSSVTETTDPPEVNSPEPTDPPEVTAPEPTDPPQVTSPEPTDPPEACAANDSCSPQTSPPSGNDGSDSQHDSGDVQSGDSHDSTSQDPSGDQSGSHDGADSGSTSGGDQSSSGSDSSGGSGG